MVSLHIYISSEKEWLPGVLGRNEATSEPKGEKRL